MILVHQSPRTLEKGHGHHPNLGVLSSPRRVYSRAEVEGWPWAADNDAYLAWDEDRYLAMLEKIIDIPGCLFVTAPDVVGDAKATLDRFYEYLYRIQEAGQPIAFVAQDGIENVGVPWSKIHALFLGGSTEFKLGPVAAEFVAEAKRCRKWVHMGRVNSRKRIAYAKSIGCDSVDGQSFSAYRKTHLPWALEAAAAPSQLRLTT